MTWLDKLIVDVVMFELGLRPLLTEEKLLRLIAFRIGA